MNSEHRIILHADAFFASVEQQSNPEFRGKPIAVIGSAKRTIITTSSYEARAFGVKTGMTTWEAKQKCSHIIFVIGDNRKYAHTSSEIVKMMMQFTPRVEVFSNRSRIPSSCDSAPFHAFGNGQHSIQVKDRPCLSTIH
jgi:DNA polymerase-4